MVPGPAARAVPAAFQLALGKRRRVRRERLFSLGSRELCTLAYRLSPVRKKPHYDLVIVGAGVAGLSAALAGADEGSVLVVAKGSLDSSNSYAAQGGVAAAVGPDDDPILHAQDTLVAGRGLCREGAVDVLTEEAPARIADLVELGVEFDKGLAREGGHSRNRVVHAGGAETGRRIADVLAARVREHPRIEIAAGEPALGLVTVDGRCSAVVTPTRTISARATVLASGGYAALWARTTNPLGAVGEGLMLAYRAGAALADLEFVQFHPTALLDDGFLLSEALRGAGATLLDEDGERFTDELAPRDVVSRAIASRDGARLDLRAIERDRYPTLMATLERAGYHPADEPIPVSPAAHYAIGGIATDLDGRTNIPGLYAAGECACTGVHGANRLASNSLLECLVFGRRAALAAGDEPAAPVDTASPVAPPDEQAVTPALRAELWREAGLIRNATGLAALLDAPSRLVRLIAQSAIARTESRGVHFREDFPAESDALAGHIVLRLGSEPALERWS
ncbi:MAG TPA: FAD-dependent oxidoreductase [Gaiellaceae bacterium]|nr:FAD-dependent oxidoreductase [Gaiellaceae bacterium]